MEKARALSANEQQALLATLAARFQKQGKRHARIDWASVQARLEAAPTRLWSLAQMEASGGEPDVVAVDPDGGVVFMDCAAESPAGRRSLCYDRAALDERKEHKPADSVVEVAEAMGIALLSEEDYRALQELGRFDCKTSSWIRTPVEIRKLGGALFCDRRYNQVFVYHNGASSYYAARGFRGKLVV